VVVAVPSAGVERSVLAWTFGAGRRDLSETDELDPDS